jgi:hypothetical protein
MLISGATNAVNRATPDKMTISELPPGAYVASLVVEQFRCSKSGGSFNLYISDILSPFESIVASIDRIVRGGE